MIVFKIRPRCVQQWAHGQRGELDYVAVPLAREFFVTRGQASPEPRPGWATPRRRPRRVHSKLAARGFAAHFCGERHGPTQAQVWRLSSPDLEHLLFSEGPVLAIDAPECRLALDGAGLELASPMQVKLEGWGGGRYVETIVGLEGSRNVTWTVSRWTWELRVHQRTVWLSLLVHIPNTLAEPLATYLDALLGHNAQAVLAALAWASEPKTLAGQQTGDSNLPSAVDGAEQDHTVTSC